ncbi:MAG: zinc-binding dehydrogenase [Capsulimonadales bacterium]|nr:zinc-binding dehydrogenase [Capsulimonadales bacterium]
MAAISAASVEELFDLLAQQKVKPVIADVMPLRDAAKANERREKGEVKGKLVLKCNFE